MGSVESVLFTWADSLDTPRADEMGRHDQRWGTGSRGQFDRKHLIFMVRGPCAKYHHDGPFRRLGAFPGWSAHVESTRSTLLMSDQTLGRARGLGVHTCIHTPGPQ